MTNNNFIFLVTFTIHGDEDDGFLKEQISNQFDNDAFPQCFANLNDAKKWVMSFFPNVICDVPGSIEIQPDFIPWDGKGDPDDHFFDNVHGCGWGADRPWLTVDDCGGAHVEFFIHKFHLR